MNTQQDAIKFAPGFPGYGTKGLDGSLGLNGISLYFSSLNGALDYSLISNAIFNNYLLDSSDTPIPGYPTRIYQNGDYFIDITTEIYVIDKSTSPYYKKTGLKLNTFGLFEDTLIKNNFGFKRYTNIVTTLNRNIIDTVYATSNANYSASPINIYGTKPENFGKIFYCNIASANDYNPFMVFTAGNFNDNAFAIVKKSNQDATDFHIGNIDASGYVRKTKMVFDFNQLLVTRDSSHRITDNSPIGSVLTNNEINAPYIFNGEKVTKQFFNVSTTATSAILKWDKTKYLHTTDSAILNKVKCDLIFYAPSEIDGSSFNYNNPYNNSIVFEDIDTTGTITLTGLKDGAPYRSYLKFSDNGWSKMSDIVECTTNLIPSIRIFGNGAEITEGKVISVPPNVTGEFTFDISTNVGNWRTSASPTTGDDIAFGNVLPATGNGKGQFKFGWSKYNTAERINSNKITISSTQYDKVFTFYIAQNAFVPKLTATPDAFTFARDASNSIIGIDTNLGEWKFTVSDPWISAYAPNGTTGNQSLNISVQSNQSVARQGSIVISSIVRPDKTVTVPIRQQVGYETGTVSFGKLAGDIGSSTDVNYNVMGAFECSNTFATPRELEVEYTLQARINPGWWTGLGGLATFGAASYTYNGGRILKASEFNSYTKIPTDLNFTLIQGSETEVEMPNNYIGDNPIIVTVKTRKIINTTGISTRIYPHQICLYRSHNYRRIQDVSMNTVLISSKIAGTDVYDIIDRENYSLHAALIDPSLFIKVYPYASNVELSSFDVVGDDREYTNYYEESSGWTEWSTNIPDYVKFRFNTTVGATTEIGTIEIKWCKVSTIVTGSITAKRGPYTRVYPVTIRPEEGVSDITLYDSNGNELALDSIRFNQWNTKWNGTIKTPNNTKWLCHAIFPTGVSQWLDYPNMGRNGAFNLTSVYVGNEDRYAEIVITDIAELYEKRIAVTFRR